MKKELSTLTILLLALLVTMGFPACGDDDDDDGDRGENLINESNGASGEGSSGDDAPPGDEASSEGPPEEAFDVCNDKAEGEACEFEAPHGTVTGTCAQVDEGFVCVPDELPGCEEVPEGSLCCGDGTCEGPENSDNCLEDCE